MSKLMIENSLQSKAFEIYYSLGAGRSLQAVADKVGRSKRSVQNWYRAYKWDERVAQRALEDAKIAGYEALQRETLAIRAEYRKAMDALMGQAKKDIEAGKIQIKSIEDLEIAIKLDLLLMGEPVECIELV